MTNTKKKFDVLLLLCKIFCLCVMTFCAVSLANIPENITYFAAVVMVAGMIGMLVLIVNQIVNHFK